MLDVRKGGTRRKLPLMVASRTAARFSRCSARLEVVYTLPTKLDESVKPQPAPQRENP